MPDAGCADNYVHVHELSSLIPMAESIRETNGTSVVAARVQSVDQTVRFGAARPDDGAASGSWRRTGPHRADLILRLCVALKRKLLVMLWRNGNFVVEKEFALPVPAITLNWCDDMICVGFKTEYSLIDSRSGAVSHLFGTGKSECPVVANLSDAELLLSVDENTIAIGKDGKPLRSRAITWNERPSGVFFYDVCACGCRCAWAHRAASGR